MTLFDDINAKISEMQATQQEQSADIQSAIGMIHDLQSQLANATNGLTAEQAQSVLASLTTLEQQMQDTASKFPEPGPPTP